ncbi:hypothetical protein AAC387_Pa03g1905 [Persea americana]
METIICSAAILQSPLAFSISLASAAGTRGALISEGVKPNPKVQTQPPLSSPITWVKMSSRQLLADSFIESSLQFIIKY